MNRRAKASCRVWCLSAVCLSCITLTASGTPFIILESSYLGDGWFQYTLTNPQNPYFQEADFTSFYVNAFTNFLAYGADPVDWQSLSPVGWNFTGSTPQNRPYQTVFLVQSQYTSYCTTNEGALVLFLLYPQSYLWSPNFSNIAGWYPLSCLIPCPPEQADGSPSNLVDAVELFPDVAINSILVISNHVQGFTFSWATDSTVLAQGTTDLVNWTNIAYALGSPPSTTWTSAVPLDAYGNVFRLALVATQQDSNLVNNAGTMTQSSMSQSAPVSEDATVSGCRIGDGGIVEATIVTESGCSYEVYLSEKSGERCQEQTFTATTSTTTVQFRPEGIASPAIIKVLRLSPG